jgi:hypothetical protein
MADVTCNTNGNIHNHHISNNNMRAITIVTTTITLRRVAMRAIYINCNGQQVENTKERIMPGGWLAPTGRTRMYPYTLAHTSVLFWSSLA